MLGAHGGALRNRVRKAKGKKGFMSKVRAMRDEVDIVGKVRPQAFCLSRGRLVRCSVCFVAS